MDHENIFWDDLPWQMGTSHFSYCIFAVKFYICMIDYAASVIVNQNILDNIFLQITNSTHFKIAFASPMW